MRQAFTLIELLVVIAIIAILSVVVILVLNPAELLRQSRDSNRISDLSIAKSGVAFYLASVTSPSIGSSTFCYVDAQASNGTTTCAWFPTASSTNPTQSTTVTNARKVNGTGWIPVNFTLITAGGPPLTTEPIDPSNNDGVHFYSYTASTTGSVFKLDAHMESTKYSNGGSNDVVQNDGGTDNLSFEAGTNLNL